MKKFALKSVRGEWQRLPDHHQACNLAGVFPYAKKAKRPVAIDLFCGAGGLSLGLEEAGFAVVLGVDSDPVCVDTRRANSGGCSFCADLSNPKQIRKIIESLKRLNISLVAAAPPCQPFSRAGRSKIRSLAGPSKQHHAQRRELWRSVVEIVKRVHPNAVLFENVPGMTEGEDIGFLAKLIEGLEQCGFELELRRIPARDLGVPQHRERVFVVGVRPGVEFRWPEPTDQKNTLRDAIDDLPEVEAGTGVACCDYSGPQKVLQKLLRQGVPREDRNRVYDHFTRAVREDDLEAFRLMDHGTKYSDLPDRLKRYRDDIFDDKYKRLAWDSVSRTITAHLAKDGYWYIHPEQHRTLTIREAARIQTFPDWFRFTGTPTHQLRQIGNAVPPLMATAIGRAVISSLGDRKRKPKDGANGSTSGSSLHARDKLLQWWDVVEAKSLTRPWLKANSLWHVLLGTILFERQTSRVVRDFWPTFSSRWPSPTAFLKDHRREGCFRVLDRANQASCLEEIARRLARGVEVKDLPEVEGLSRDRLRMCAAIAGNGVACEPSTPGVRVAARILGIPKSDSRIDGQLSLVRLLGSSRLAVGSAALLAIADQFCRPSEPSCEECPMVAHCKSARNSDA